LMFWFTTISLFFLLVSVIPIAFGLIQIPKDQLQKLGSIPKLAYGIMGIFSLIGFLSVCFLYAMRKIGFYIYLVSVGLNILLRGYYILFTNWLKTLNGIALFWEILNWIILALFVFYLARINKKGRFK
jgi:hypothetical protein